MSVGTANAPKPTAFASLSEAVATAAYVEQQLGAEHQWITNRLSWLFVSQSFCITAFVILMTSTGVRFGAEHQAEVLRISLPLLGITSCVVVGLSVWAAADEAARLADELARLSRYINAHSPATIPLVGAGKGLRDNRWTHFCGTLPQRVLPWVLAIFWWSLC